MRDLAGFEKEASGDVFIHFSKSPVSDFSSGHFQVSAEGRVYCMRQSVGWLDNPTINNSCKSAVVFRGEAAKKFKRHRWASVLFFKWLFGQFVSSRMGDIKWHDGVVAHDVVEVSDFVDIPEGARRRKVVRNIIVFKLIDFSLISFCIFMLSMVGLVQLGYREMLEGVPVVGATLVFLTGIASWVAEHGAILLSLSVLALVLAFLAGKYFQRKNRLTPGIAAGLQELGYLVDEDGSGASKIT
ncbi:hypothetical protein ACIP01_07695 [Pseudomonas monteilii]|uniref:hypothetical protein n=1 Tax=Pseudomonas monteilii TaxID=76759 RepID=UPI00381F8DCA